MSLLKLDASVLLLVPYNFPYETVKSDMFKKSKIVHSVPALVSELYSDEYDIVSVELNSILENPLYTTKHFVKSIDIVCRSINKKTPKTLVYARNMNNVALIRELIDANFHAISMHTELLTNAEKLEIGKLILEGKRWIDPISEDLLYPISTAKRRPNKLETAKLEGRVGYFVCPLVDCKIASTNSARLKRDLNLTCHSVKSLPELFPILANPTTQVDIVWLDAESISNHNSSNYIDIINTIVTLINVTGRQGRTHISIVVGKKTPVELIKEIIKTTGVNSIAPRAGDYPYEEIKQACSKVLQGKSFVPVVIKNLLKRKTKNNHDPNKLTIRQKQIVDLIIDTGSSNKNIARRLKITESAVKRQLTGILRKTKTKNRTQLVLLKKEKVAE